MCFKIDQEVNCILGQVPSIYTCNVKKTYLLSVHEALTISPCRIMSYVVGQCIEEISQVEMMVVVKGESEISTKV